MGIRVTREQGVMVSISTIVAFVGAVATCVPVAEWALAGEIQKQIAPLVMSQITQIQSTVKNLQNQITALEFKRDMCANPPNREGCWTVRDAQDLTGAKNDLAAAEESLRGLHEAQK